MALKAHGRNSGVYIKQKARDLPKEKLSDIDTKLYHALTSYHNASRNFIDYLNDTYEGLFTPTKFLALLWAYKMQFFSKPYIVKELRINTDSSKNPLRFLSKYGWIEEYSPRQFVDVMRTVNDEGGIGMYQVEEKKVLAPRYCLTTTGRREVRKFLKLFNDDEFILPIAREQ